MWSTYKDVAHLVTAATFVFAHARNMAGPKPFGPSGLSSGQFGQFTMTMLMPDLIIGVALSFECLTALLRVRRRVQHSCCDRRRARLTWTGGRAQVSADATVW
jgi:hypothetical protein